MPSWILKAAVQGALSRLPDPQRANRWFQKYVTRSLNLDESYFDEKLAQCLRHLEHQRAHGNAEGFTALELGTGWFPVVPVGLALSGAEKVYTIDQQPLLDTETLGRTLRAYRRALSRDKLTEPNPERRATLLALSEADPTDTRSSLMALGIEPLIGDARQLPLASGSVDLVCSNNTLEHIPGPVIFDIFTEFHRVATRDGVMSHHIDMADHYTTFDRNIDVYNFLRFSESTWRWFNNPLQYQNRLRVTDHRKIHEETAWKIVSETNQSKSIDVLKALDLAPEFRKYEPEELAIYDSWIVSRRAPKSRARTRT